MKSSSVGKFLKPNLWLMLSVLLLGGSPLVVQADVAFQWNGFATFGAGILDDDSINETNAVVHNGYDEHGATDVDSRIGFQGTAIFNPATSATLQIVSDSATDETEVEWAYLSYDFSDALMLRVGRLRKPMYTNSDFLPVGYIYQWARPPLEVYARDIQIYDGIEAVDLVYRTAAGSWDLQTEFYYGQSDGAADLAAGEEGDYRTRGDAGLVLEFEKNGLSFRFGYHRSPDIDVDTGDDLQMLFDALNGAGFSDLVSDMEIDGIEAEFYNLGVNYDVNNWLFAAEYVYLPTEGGLAPDENSWYLTTGRRIGAWTYLFTYGDRRREAEDDFAQPILDQAAAIGAPFNAGLLILADSVEQAERLQELDLHSYTIGMRYDFEQPVSLKAEYQYIVDDENDLSNNLISVVVDFLF